MMPAWPHYLAYALDMMLLYHYPEDEEYISRLVQQWGSLDLEALLQILEKGSDQDRLFAIHALGYLNNASSRVTLVRFLVSSNSLERWSSALALGRMHDDISLPILTAMLTEHLPPDEEYSQVPYYRGWRFCIPELLATWGDSAPVPAIRRALQAIVLVEHGMPELPSGSTSYSDREDWIRFEDRLVYTLGRLGAFGALTGIIGADDHLDVWRVHMAVGYLHDRFQLSGYNLWQDNSELYRDVQTLLERRFGLSAEERKQAMELYDIVKSFEVLERHRAEDKRSRGLIF